MRLFITLYHSTFLGALLLWHSSSNNSCLACTVLMVGKEASTDGSVLVTHSNDGEFETDPRLVKVPSQHYDQDTLRPVYFSPESYPRYVGTDRGVPEYFPSDAQESFVPIGYIPQVEHTFSYLEETYGAVNEHQVAIGESTCSGVFGAIPLGAPNGTALLSIDELTHIAMERAVSAQSAIQIMGDLAVEYGFYGAGEFEGTAESLAVSDAQEAWIFHILPDPTGKSAIWAAQRVQSDSFAVLANMFVIRQVDPADNVNFLMSDSVHQVALDYGWWNASQGLLDFTKVYSDGEYAHKYYSGRRMWGAYHLAGLEYPSDYVDLQSDPVYPVYARPAQKLSAQDLFRFHRYTYQGTQFDLGAPGNLAGGPFGTPDRWKGGTGEQHVSGNWERAIGLYRTSDTYVVQSKATAVDAILWFAPASPLGSVFTPFTVSMSDIPTSFRSGHQQDFSRTSAFWAACVVHNIANLKWSYMIKDIELVQDRLEATSIALVENMMMHRSLYDNGDETMEVALLDNAAKVVSELWELSDALLFKYASGFVNVLPDGMSQMVGYPAWWLEAVGYPNGPPPPPTVPKCCHPDSGSSNVVLTGKAAMKEYLRTQ